MEQSSRQEYWFYSEWSLANSPIARIAEYLKQDPNGKKTSKPKQNNQTDINENDNFERAGKFGNIGIRRTFKMFYL